MDGLLIEWLSHYDHNCSLLGSQKRKKILYSVNKCSSDINIISNETKCKISNSRELKKKKLNKYFRWRHCLRFICNLHPYFEKKKTIWKKRNNKKNHKRWLNNYSITIDGSYLWQNHTRINASYVVCVRLIIYFSNTLS